LQHILVFDSSSNPTFASNLGTNTNLLSRNATAKKCLKDDIKEAIQAAHTNCIRVSQR